LGWKLLELQCKAYWLLKHFLNKINKIINTKIYSNPKVYLVFLEGSCWIRFNKFYFIIFLLKVWKILNFEWILLKIQTNYKKLGLEGKMSWMCSHLGPIYNTCYLIYLWRKVVCFVLSQWYFPSHNILGYVMEHIIKKFSMNRGAPTWFRMLRAIVWNLLIIEPFFHWSFWKTKIENYIRIWGHFWYCWKTFTEFDLIKLN
jgi:hypothetical protein